MQAAASKDVAYSHDAAGNLTAVTDALGHTVTLTYNANNELVSVRDALNNITTYGYDAEGNVTTVEDAGVHHKLRCRPGQQFGLGHRSTE